MPGRNSSSFNGRSRCYLFFVSPVPLLERQAGRGAMPRTGPGFDMLTAIAFARLRAIDLVCVRAMDAPGHQAIRGRPMTASAP